MTADAARDEQPRAGPPTLLFPDPVVWERWLMQNHAGAPGL